MFPAIMPWPMTDEDSAKDMATCTRTGERGVMVAMGHGLCVCFGVC